MDALSLLYENDLFGRLAAKHLKKKSFNANLAEMNDGEVECRFVCILNAKIHDTKEHGVLIKRPGLITMAKEAIKSATGRDERVLAAFEAGDETVLLMLKPKDLSLDEDSNPAELDQSLVDYGFASAKGMDVVTLATTEIHLEDGHFTLEPESGRRTVRHIYAVTPDEASNEFEAQSWEWLRSKCS